MKSLQMESRLLLGAQLAPRLLGRLERLVERLPVPHLGREARALGVHVRGGLGKDGRVV